MSYQSCSDDNSRLAQARTGTGKTLAFLIPVLQNILKYDPSLESRARGRDKARATDIRAIIISPTRELAEQIAVEARKVVAETGVVVQTAVGGSQKSFHLRKMKAEGCHILIGTPGRLNDILSDPYSDVRAPNLSAFVLDEADRLLDQGFAPEIDQIQRSLPRREEVDRQTLLFSATVPQEVMQIVRKTMKQNFKFVRTVQEGEQQTHERVPQKVVITSGLENFMPALLELCQRELARKDAESPFKAIVYFNATAEAKLASSTFQNLTNPGTSRFNQHPLYPARLIEMHARLTQEGRTRAADAFRRASSAIMFSSDVTARGMDFPNVTHVIQMGVPPTRDTYIHRLGRTARGDKKGEGFLFLSDLESRETWKRLDHLPLRTDESLETARIDMTRDAQLPEYNARILTQVAEATKGVSMAIKGAAYLASFGTYQWMHKKQTLVDLMNNRSKFAWGLATPPAVPSRLAQKLGVSRLAGINIGAPEHESAISAGRGYGSSRFDRDRGDSGSGGYSRDSHSREGFSRDRDGFPRERSSPRGEFGGGRGRGTYADRAGVPYSSTRPDRSRGSYGQGQGSRSSFGQRGGRDGDGEGSYRRTS